MCKQSLRRQILTNRKGAIFSWFSPVLSQKFLDFLFFIHVHHKKTKVFLRQFLGNLQNWKMAEIRQKIFSFLWKNVLQKNLGFLATGKIGGYPSVCAPLQFLHESIFRHSPSFTATAEKKGWIVSKANKTGQFSIITTTPDVQVFHNYPTVYDGPPLLS